ncbi:MAG TPA: hypothetical protein VH437_14440 [Terriglobales bacterium]|jgi:hypothetical protein
MTNETAALDAQRSNQWKQTFESALHELGAADEPSSARSRPIVARRRIAEIPVDPHTAQKRALADAANALAALWKRSTKNDTEPQRHRVSVPVRQPAHTF